MLMALHAVGNAQLLFKLEWIQDSLAWGVFVKPDSGTKPSGSLMVGSGQVTLVAPKDYAFKALKCFSGMWHQNATVTAPKENTSSDYISFGLVSLDIPIPLKEGKETLLFTFATKSGVAPQKLYLIEKDDPFAQLPNSAFTNPGNDMTVLDVEKQAIYYYSGNYGHDRWLPSLKNGMKPEFLQGLGANTLKPFLKP